MNIREHGRKHYATIIRGCTAFLMCGFFLSTNISPIFSQVQKEVPCFSIVTLEKGQDLKDLAIIYNTTVDHILLDNPHVVDNIEAGITLTIREDTHKNIASKEDAVQTLSRGTKEEWIWPAIGPISSDYGLRGYNQFHHGIDLAIDSGTPIRASRSGKVVKAEYIGVYGLTLLIDHGNGIETLYGHNQQLLVKAGDYVKAGEKIALSGNTGRSTGPHLHFEIRYYGKTVDPKNHLPRHYMASE